ncbi:MAG: TetR/AcrR family transcriptional regulator [Betaproteobacteria bacterium]|nr:TetR/AcrR family transcriptional regulator [Betaproteobacteria bacterium]
MAYRRSKRIEAKLADNRTQILQAARRLVSEGGWPEAQMAAIAAAANLATGTVYRYFSSKAELFAEVLASVSQREVDVIQGVAESGGPAKQRLADAVVAFTTRALRGRRLAYALIAEPCDPEIDQARLVYRRAIGEKLQRIIADGVTTGEFPAQDPRVAASCVVGAMMEALVGPLAPESIQLKAGSQDFVSEIVRFCLRAVTAPESRPRPDLALRVLKGGRTKPSLKGGKRE